MEMNAETKALLVSIGSAGIDERLLREDARTTIPSAGPGAGLESFFIRSGCRRVGLSINKKSPLRVIGYCKGVVVLKDGKPIVAGELEPALSHCPEQANITISSRCIYDCKYCPVPLRKGETDVVRPKAERLLKLARWREILDEQGLRADLAETMCLPCTGCDITPHRDV